MAEELANQAEDASWEDANPFYKAGYTDGYNWKMHRLSDNPEHLLPEVPDPGPMQSLDDMTEHITAK